MLINDREERGKAIAQGNGQVRRIDENHYAVKSQSRHGEYTVSRKGDEWVCECPDNHWRHTICKHIFAVDFSIQLRKEVLAHGQVIQEVNISNCRYCGSTNLKKVWHTPQQKRRHTKILLPRLPAPLHSKHRLRTHETQPKSNHHSHATIL